MRKKTTVESGRVDGRKIPRNLSENPAKTNENFEDFLQKKQKLPSSSWRNWT